MSSDIEADRWGRRKKMSRMGPNQLFMFVADEAVPRPLDVYRLSGGCLLLLLLL